MDQNCVEIVPTASFEKGNLVLYYNNYFLHDDVFFIKSDINLNSTSRLMLSLFVQSQTDNINQMITIAEFTVQSVFWKIKLYCNHFDCKHIV
jgi:hypothetical protein